MTDRTLEITAPRASRIAPLDLAAAPGSPQGAAAVGPTYRVEIAASLVSPGTELLGWRAGPGAGQVSRPGYTATGRVVEAFAGADPSLVGRDVYVFPESNRQAGCHASARWVGGDALLIPLPDGLDPGKACFARMINIALTPLAFTPASKLDVVLVIGLGLVGQFAARVGMARGARVLAVDPSASRRERAGAAGVSNVIDPAAVDLVARVRDLTAGRGAGLVINATGLTATFPAAVQCVADGGELSTLGAARQEDDTPAWGLLHAAQQRHVTLRGGWKMLLPRRSSPAQAGSSTEDHLRLALRWLAEDAIDLSAIWTHDLPADRLPEAYVALDRADPDWLGVIARWA